MLFMIIALILAMLSVVWILQFWGWSIKMLFGCIVAGLGWMWNHMKITCILAGLVLVLTVVIVVLTIVNPSAADSLTGSGVFRFILKLTASPRLFDGLNSLVDKVFTGLFSADTTAGMFGAAVCVYLVSYLIPALAIVTPILMVAVCFVRLFAVTAAADLILRKVRG